MSKVFYSSSVMTFPQRDSSPSVWQQQQRRRRRQQQQQQRRRQQQQRRRRRQQQRRQQQKQQNNITYIVSVYCEDLFIMQAHRKCNSNKIRNKIFTLMYLKIQGRWPLSAVQEILFSLQLNGTLPWSEITPSDPIIIEMSSIYTPTNCFSMVFRLVLTWKFISECINCFVGYPEEMHHF
jgi:type II secretory pathway pseudopilin PulG